MKHAVSNARVAQRDEPSSRRAQIEADVLQATLELLREGARWNDLSVERIAVSAGISRTAFYFYFRDKRDVLMRLVGDVGEEIWALSNWITDERVGEDDLMHIFQRLRDLAREHGALLQAIVETSAVDGEVSRFFHGVIDRFATGVRERAEALAAAGHADPVTPTADAARVMVITVVTAFYDWRVRGQELTDERIGALTELIRRAIYG